MQVVRLLLALVLVAGAAPPARGQIAVVAEFEGASAKVLLLDQEKRLVRIMPAGDPARGWPCWWHLKLEGLKSGQTLTLEVQPSDRPIVREGKNQGRPLAASWSQPLRAAVSHDGHKWKQSEPGVAAEGRIAYTVAAEGESVWLAWGPPFTPRDSAALVTKLAQRGPWVQGFELCKSREGRPCPALRFREGDRPDKERIGIWLQARQHAWESGSSWVGRGLAEWLAGDDPRARSLREKSEIYLVPIMDIDNTATGNGGKEALPQDHNRDWTERPHYPEVAAAQRQIQAWSDAGRMALFIDLHNPGPGERQPFFYVCPDDTLTELGCRNLERFLAACRVEMTGPLALADQPKVSGASYDPLWRQMSKNWVAAHAPGHAVAVTLETAWNTPHSTPDGYRAVGAQLGMAIERYLRDDPRK